MVDALQQIQVWGLEDFYRGGVGGGRNHQSEGRRLSGKYRSQKWRAGFLDANKDQFGQLEGLARSGDVGFCDC